MRVRDLVAFLSLLVIFPVNLKADVVPGRWEKVEALRPGAEIEIDMQDDSRIRGAYLKSDHRTLVIAEDDRDRLIEKQAVKRVYRIQTEESKRTGIGLAAGLGVGLLGAIMMAPAEERNEGTALLIGLPVGAAIGGMVGWTLSGED